MEPSAELKALVELYDRQVAIYAQTSGHLALLDCISEMDNIARRIALRLSAEIKEN